MSRKKCWDCTLKHVAQSVVLMEEYFSSHKYKYYHGLAIGHLAEAEAECPDAGLAGLIREIRIGLYEKVDLDLVNLLGKVYEMASTNMDSEERFAS